MLHHVSLEVPPAEIDRTVKFWTLLGFDKLDAPEEIAQYVTWLERVVDQINLIHTEEATVPVLGHPRSSQTTSIPLSPGLATPASGSRTPPSCGANRAPSRSPLPTTASS